MLAMGVLIGLGGDEAKAHGVGIGGDEGHAGADGSRGCETAHRICGVFVALVTLRDRPSCNSGVVVVHVR
jgi:hypothetical protein